MTDLEQLKLDQCEVISVVVGRWIDACGGVFKVRWTALAAGLRAGKGHNGDPKWQLERVAKWLAYLVSDKES